MTQSHDFWQLTYPHWVDTANGRRSIETSALTAVLPALALVPLCLLALAVFWLPLHAFSSVSYIAFAGFYVAGAVLLFIKPVQVGLLIPLLGARRPTRDERGLLDTGWRSVLQVNRLPRNRFVLAVLPSNELNAYACGGHLVIVTSFAAATLPRDELCGVLAHELSHHLGLHTVALTIGQWLSLPVLLLARIGFFLQSVATAATDNFARNSPSLTAVGQLIRAVVTAVSWIFLAGLLVSNAIANAVGRNAEFQADERAVAMGFGRPLSMALRRVISMGDGRRPTTWRDRLAATHPPARTRVARIEAMVRRGATS